MSWEALQGRTAVCPYQERKHSKFIATPRLWIG